MGNYIQDNYISWDLSTKCTELLIILKKFLLMFFSQDLGFFILSLTIPVRPP